MFLGIFFYFIYLSLFDISSISLLFSLFFFLNDPAPPEIYPFPLHDALPICKQPGLPALLTAEEGAYDKGRQEVKVSGPQTVKDHAFRSGKADADRYTVEIGGKKIDVYLPQDRKSTRLNSSHQIISYAVFCLK